MIFDFQIWLITLCMSSMMCLSTSANGQEIKWDDFVEHTQGMPRERIWEKPIHLGHGITRTATVLITNKGNGTLAIRNVNVRIVDCHADQTLFVPYLLRTEFEDVTADGYKDIVIHGTVSFFEDEDMEREHPVYDSICMIIVYDPKRDWFDLRYFSLPERLKFDYIWLAPEWNVKHRPHHGLTRKRTIRH